MILMPDPYWPQLALAAILLGDALLSMRAPAFIRECLHGVRFPRDWWWTLIVIKMLAATGRSYRCQVVPRSVFRSWNTSRAMNRLRQRSTSFLESPSLSRRCM